MLIPAPGKLCTAAGPVRLLAGQSVLIRVSASGFTCTPSLFMTAVASETHAAEGVVPPDGTTDGAPLLVVAEFGCGRTRRREPIGRGQSLVPVEVVRGAVKGVGSGLDHHIQHAARVAVFFGTAAALEREFVDRVNREHDAGNARHAALIDGIDVMPKVVVVGAVYLPVDAVKPGPVQGAVGVGARVK